jgi:sirohydrochlorin ferrochelatase
LGSSDGSGSSGASAVLLVGHGSRDPRAATVVAELAAQVRLARPGWRVAVAHLDFTQPSVGVALTELAADGAREVAVVPLLFAPGYHLRVDLPAAVAEVRAGLPWLSVSIAEPLAAAPQPDERDLLLDALEARLTEAPPLVWPSNARDEGRIGPPPHALDGQTCSRRPEQGGWGGVVLASAGSSDPGARQAVEDLAGRWSDRLSMPVVTGYATAGGRSIPDAVQLLQGRRVQRVAVAGLFVAPGRLPEAARRTAVASGAAVIAEPLGAERHLVTLIARRAGVRSTV